MRKLAIWLAVASLALVSAVGFTQTAEYQTVVLSGTADHLIDSTLTSTYLGSKRVYINSIYAWYDNAANTNAIQVDVVRGQSAMATSNLRRYFHFSEAMASGGYKSFVWIPNITVQGDSTVYFSVQATSSDSLFLAVNYKLIN